MAATSVAEQWVDEAARRCHPDRVVWHGGSEEEFERLVDAMLRDATLHRLNQFTYPNCYLHRSHPQDVARTEHLTYVCTPRREDAGPTNNWMTPAEAEERVGALFNGSMRGRTMYVIPYLMGPVGSPYSRVGIMVSDSAYVTASMHIMTRAGRVALEHLRTPEDFVAGLHSLADLSPERRFIMHFPQERLIWSVGTGYGGNAILAKKCHSLRIASWQARQEGWMAEHMLILGLEDPSGEVTYLAAAMPSASGKTNLAMVQSALPGYRVWTLGDDIAWLNVDDKGQLWAINPEQGSFGVAPGTNINTNPSALEMIRRNALFTNVAVSPGGEPWWEGTSDAPPAGLLDWQGRPWQPEAGPAAHPNSRFTAYLRQCPTISPRWEDPKGVPISGIIFGARRSRDVPLVFEAFDWQHGVYMGASMGTETTAAATGKVGVVRRDPMAMLPFCGYNMGDYFAHWLEMGRRLAVPPRIFRINWFRRGADGRFLWPGYCENVRVLKWIVERIKRKARAIETPVGLIPSPDDLDLTGLELGGPEAPHSAVAEALSYDREGWLQELEEQRTLFEQFGDRIPASIWEEHARTGREIHR
ncbi:MAG: phosphoenolpyruvate carboxykinase (GTP) [Armatimonadetes bacterium]|nr:phosphoenolpyruvate carboxykinase (GTP) [Armatimonadota bacterium]